MPQLLEFLKKVLYLLKMAKPTKTQNYSNLIADLSSFIERGRREAVRYVNIALVATYWLVGRRIVEYEQKGKKKARYGEELLVRLATDLTGRFGRGFSKSNLFMMRAFYLAYPETAIFQTVSGKSTLVKPVLISVHLETTSAVIPAIFCAGISCMTDGDSGTKECRNDIKVEFPDGP